MTPGTTCPHDFKELAWSDHEPKEDLLTGRRKREVSSARALVSYLAVQEMGYRFTEVGQALNIHPVNIARSLEKGEKLFDKFREKWDGRN